ncbi:hypothetical protein [Komagataeibacter intermedius]|uniref:hypothetical protein n=1 Tax=Komagataeibacter intermedius TaxID=66229 RepID=UPI001F24672C|nr:hypothetical protein [Komagataeibacter intermedius]
MSSAVPAGLRISMNCRVTVWILCGALSCRIMPPPPDRPELTCRISGADVACTAFVPCAALPDGAAWDVAEAA